MLAQSQPVVFDIPKVCQFIFDLRLKLKFGEITRLTGTEIYLAALPKSKFKVILPLTLPSPYPSFLTSTLPRVSTSFLSLFWHIANIYLDKLDKCSLF